MTDRGAFLYDLVAMSAEEAVVGLKVDVPTYSAFLLLIYHEKRVTERLVKLARAGLDKDFNEAAISALFYDQVCEIPVGAIDYDRLGRLLVLAWRDEPLESVPVKHGPQPPSLRSAREAGDASQYLKSVRHYLRNLVGEIAEITPSHPEGPEE